MCILVVDDLEDCRAAFKVVLAHGGYEDVTVLDSAVAAFSFLRLEDPRAPAPHVMLVFLDIVMPGVDGINACERIRSDPRYADIPIVITTALDDIQSVESAFNSGATDYLTKPLKAVDLLACVRAKFALKAEVDRRNKRERELAQHVPFQFDALA